MGQNNALIAFHGIDREPAILHQLEETLNQLSDELMESEMLLVSE